MYNSSTVVVAGCFFFARRSRDKLHQSSSRIEKVSGNADAQENIILTTREEKSPSAKQTACARGISPHT